MGIITPMALAPLVFSQSMDLVHRLIEHSVIQPEPAPEPEPASALAASAYVPYTAQTEPFERELSPVEAELGFIEAKDLHSSVSPRDKDPQRSASPRKSQTITPRKPQSGMHEQDRIAQQDDRWEVRGEFSLCVHRLLLTRKKCNFSVRCCVLT